MALVVPFLVAGGVAYGLYHVQKSQSEYVATKNIMGKAPMDIGSIREYVDASAYQTDNTRITTNTGQYGPKVLREEIGPYGIPRTIYSGTGGARVPVYGHNYANL